MSRSKAGRYVGRGVAIGLVLALLGGAAWWVSHGQLQRRTAAYEREALKAQQANDASRAEFQWLAALAISPHDAGAYLGLGDLYQVNNNSALAIVCYQHAISANPHEPHSYCRLALAEEDQRDHLQAIQDAQTELKLDPNCARALALLSVLDRRSGETTRANQEAEKAFKADPTYEPAVTEYVTSFMKDEPDRAAKVLLSVLPHFPQSSRIAYVLGWCEVRSGELDGLVKGEAELRRAETLAPHAGLVHRELSRLLLSRGDVNDAVLEGAMAVRDDPTGTPSYAQYAAALNRAGKAGQAAAIEARQRALQQSVDRLAQLQEMLLHHPADPSVTHQIVQIDLRLGNVSTPQVLLDAALTAHPGDPTLLKDLKDVEAAAAQ